MRWGPRRKLTDEEKSFRKLQSRWRSETTTDGFSKDELIRLAEYYLGKDDLEDAADLLEALSARFPYFEGRHELAEANNALGRVWKALRELKEAA